MRLLLIAFATLIALAATPAAAACGNAPAGASMTGRHYNGNVVWAGGGTYNIDMDLAADCSLTYAIYMGSTQKGVWRQAGKTVSFDLPAIDLHYSGTVEGSTFSGTVTTKGSTGTFKFTQQSKSGVLTGACAKSAAVAGRTFTGAMKFDYRGLSTLNVTFNPDCTMTRSSGTSGTWKETRDGVTFSFVPGTTYTGVLKYGVLAGDIQSGPDHGTFHIANGQALGTRICGSIGQPDPAGHVYDGPVQFKNGKPFAMAVRLNLDCSVTLTWTGHEERGGTWSQGAGRIRFTTSGEDPTVYEGVLGTDDVFKGGMKNFAGDTGTFTFKLRS